jgi:transposase
MHAGVRIDEGQILALLGREIGSLSVRHLIRLSIHLGLQPGGSNECTLSCGVDPIRAQRAWGASERGKHPARKLKRAQILLAADAGVSDEAIAMSVEVGGSTVYRTKRRFVEGNMERALSEDPRPGAERKLTGKEEALLVATACSSPPAGRARWTLGLLAMRWSS